MNENRSYNLTELLACVAAGLLENGRSTFVGTGFPILAAMLAQRTHAPGLLIIFEAGGIGPHVPVLRKLTGRTTTPVLVPDPRMVRVRGPALMP